MKTKPTIGSYTDDEERELIEALEAPDAKFKSHLTPARKKQIEAIARATMSGEREKITIRISKNDLSRIKSKAMQEGMPYQTLISSILHKAVS
jgi:predicted DNA binding CopG/RHH family protein